MQAKEKYIHYRISTRETWMSDEKPESTDDIIYVPFKMWRTGSQGENGQFMAMVNLFVGLPVSTKEEVKVWVEKKQSNWLED